MCPVDLGDGGMALYHVNVPGWSCGVCGWTPTEVVACPTCYANPARSESRGKGGTLEMKVVECERCAIEKQLRAAREVAATVPDLEAQLAALGGPRDA
jgi:hypothetical protein